MDNTLGSDICNNGLIVGFEKIYHDTLISISIIDINGGKTLLKSEKVNQILFNQRVNTIKINATLFLYLCVCVYMCDLLCVCVCVCLDCCVLLFFFETRIKTKQNTDTTHNQKTQQKEQAISIQYTYCDETAYQFGQTQTSMVHSEQFVEIFFLSVLLLFLSV